MLLSFVYYLYKNNLIIDSNIINVKKGGQKRINIKEI